MSAAEQGAPQEHDEQEHDEQQDGESSILADGGVDTDARAGRSLGIDPDEEPDEETAQEMEEEREKRLDPDNRPDGAEVDNTQRDFDVARGQFTDSEDYDESEPAPYVDPENPNQQDDSADSDEDDSSEEQPDDEQEAGS